MHVLVVEEDLDTGDLLQQALRNAGYRVSQTRRVAEAMQLSQRHPDINVVVIDMRSPRRFCAMDIADKMRSRLHQRHYVLASADWDTLEPHCPDDVTVLRKPYGRSDLLQAVGRSLVSFLPYRLSTAPRHVVTQPM